MSRKLLTSALLAAGLFTAGAAQAALINVGGVVWDPSAPVDFFAQSNLWERVIAGTGNDLTGIGNVTALNNKDNIGSDAFCPGCELTYEFGGFTLTDIIPATGTQTKDQLVFSGGWLKIYVDTNQDFDPNNKNTATNGTLWLSLVGHTNIDTQLGKSGTLFGSINTGTLGTGQDNGGGEGLFDVVGGVAKGNFDTNSRPDSIGGFADFTFSSSYQPQGSVTPDGYGLGGTGELRGNSIPEPGSLALAGLGLLGLAGIRRRKQ